jgi:tetratricopeptide (TPR) repeat protein
MILYSATLPKEVLPGDSGELIASSRTLSIAHPPGYPLYLMAGRLFSLIVSIGSVAYRYNLMSAVVAALAQVLFYLILARLGLRRSIALAVTLAMGTLEAFWLQATTAEVYALNGFFTLLLLYTALMGGVYGQRTFLLLGLFGGLALSHHLSLIYPLACAAGILVFKAGVRPKPKTALLSFLFLLLGLSAWLYILVRAGVGPPLVWGRTDTLSGFLSHITAQGYRWRLRQFVLMARAANFLEFFGVIAWQAGLPLTLAALLGIGASLRRLRVILFFVCLVLMFGVHFAMYNIPDIESHMFPGLLGIGILAAIGLDRLTDLARRLHRRAGLLVAACSFLLVVPGLLSIHPRADEWFAGDYARAIQQSSREACGDTCLVITSGHLSTFPLLYLSLVEPGGVRIFDIMASNPAIIGAETRSANLEESVSRAAEIFGISNIALLGPLPPYILGKEPVICGMVYVLDEVDQACRSPLAYNIRGVGEDLREYSSRLLTGSYNLHVARWHAQQGDLDGVRRHVDSALEAASDDVGTHINGARIYISNGMFEEAVAASRAAVAVDPDFFGAHDLMASILARMGNLDDAISEYRAALKGNPAPAGVYSNLANAYLSKGDHRSALENFEEAIAVDSTMVNAYVGAGLTLDAMGEPDRALALFRQARSIDTFAQPAYHAEASLLLRMERSGEAAGVARAGLGNLPGSALLLSDLGLAYLRSDEVDSAIVYLEAAVEYDASLLNARGNLAVALERQGLTSRAIEQYRIYLETAPPGRSRDVASRALERLGAGPED